MGRILSTISDFLGSFAYESRKSAAIQQDFIDVFSGPTDDILDFITDNDLSLSTYPYRVIKGPDDTTEQFVKHLVDSGDYFKIHKGAALKVIERLCASSQTISNNDGIAFVINFKASTQTLWSDINIKVVTGNGFNSNYPLLYFRNIFVFEYQGEYYIGKFLFAQTGHDDSAYYNYYKDICPPANSLGDPSQFFITVARMYRRDNYYNSILEGKKVINNYLDMGFNDTELQNMSDAVFFKEAFGTVFDDDVAESFIIGLNAEAGTSWINIIDFLEKFSSSLAINNINSFVSASMSSLSAATGKVMTFLSSIKSNSVEVLNYVATLKSMMTTDNLTFAGKFAGLWNRASVQTETGDDTLMGFQDKGSAAPTIYLTGVVRTVITVAAQVIGMAITIITKGIGRIIGIALQAIGAFIEAITQKVESDTLAYVNEEYNVSSLPFYEWAIAGSNLTNLDIVDEIREYGFVSYNLAFGKIFIFSGDGITYWLTIFPSPVSEDWVNQIGDEIHDNSMISKDSHDHYVFSSYSKAVALRELMADYDDELFTIMPDWITSKQDFDKWLRYSTAFGILACRLFVLLLQGSGMELRPYTIGTNQPQWGNSSPQGDSLLHFWMNAHDANLSTDVVKNSTPSWRQVMGIDSFSYSSYPSLFLNLSLSEIPYYQSSSSGYFNANADNIGNVLTATVPSNWRWGMEEIPTSCYHIPTVDADSVILGAIIVAITTVAVITVSALIYTKIKRAKLKSSAMHKAKAEQAWANYLDDPSNENYTAYRKAVRSNNFASKFNGGDKLGYSSYWDGGDESVASGSPLANRVFDSIQSKTDASLTQSQDNNEGIEDIKILIRGEI